MMQLLSGVGAVYLLSIGFAGGFFVAFLLSRGIIRGLEREKEMLLRIASGKCNWVDSESVRKTGAHG